MRITIRSLLAVLTLTFVLTSCRTTTFAPEMKAKCGESLLELIDRFEGAKSDTVITLTVRFNKVLSDSERDVLKSGCEIQAMKALEHVVLLQLHSANVPCVANYDFVKELRLSPASSISP